MTLPSDRLGDIVVSTLAIAAGILKWLSDRADKKEKESDEDVDSSYNDDNDELEVVTKKEFNALIATVNKATESITAARNSFEDTLACSTIINILLQVIGTDRRRVMIRMAEEEVYSFLRHSDFPSRQMVTTMFECAVKELNDKLDDETMKAEGTKEYVESRTNI